MQIKWKESSAKHTFQPYTQYTRIWWFIIQEFKLSPNVAFLLFLIYGLSRKDGYCSASKKYLAKTLCITETTVYSLLKKLKRRRFVEVVKALTKYRTEHEVVTLRLCKPLKELIDFLELQLFSNSELSSSDEITIRDLVNEVRSIEDMPPNWNY